MRHKSNDCFCCHRRNHRVATDENRLRFCTFLAASVFGMHYQIKNWMRICVVSITSLLCFMKCNPMTGAVNFFMTTKSSANVISPLSNIEVLIAMGFSKSPFAISI